MIMTRKLLLEVAALAIIVVFYMVQYAALALPTGFNLVSIYYYALENSLNMLFAITKYLMWLPPTAVSAVLIITSIIPYAILFYVIDKISKFEGFIGSLAFFTLTPVLHYVVINELYLYFLPAGLSLLSFTLALTNTRRNVIISIVLLLISSLIYPKITAIYLVAMIVYIIILWLAYRKVEMKLLTVANSAFLAYALLNPLVETPELTMTYNSVPLPYATLLLALFTIIAIPSLPTLFKKDNKTVLWMFSWFFTCLIYVGYIGPLVTLMLITPLTSYLMYQMLLYCRYGFKVFKEKGERVLSIDMLSLISLALIVAAVSLSLIISFQLFREAHEKTLFTTDTTVLSRIADDVFKQGSEVLAPTPLMPWLTWKFHLKPATPNTEYANSWLTSSFTIQTEHFRLEDLEPFTQSRAPLIKIFNGTTYNKVLYIDDSYVKATLFNVKTKDTWNESIYGMCFLNYSISNNGYVLSFRSKWVKIVKKVKALRDNEFKISYKFTSLNPNVKILSITLNLWAAWGVKVNESLTLDNKLYILIAGNLLEITYPKGSKIIPAYDSKWTQDHFIFTAPIIGREATYSIKVKILNPVKSENKPYTTSILNYLSKCSSRDIRIYVLAPKNTYLEKLQDKPENITATYMISSFNYIQLSIGGNVETYSLHEGHVVENTGNQTLIVTRLPHLNVEFRVRKINEKTLSLSISGKTKGGGKIEKLTMIFWIPWERYIVQTHITLNNVRLKLDKGTINVAFKNETPQVYIGPHPKYGQEMIKITYDVRRRRTFNTMLNITSIQNIAYSFRGEKDYYVVYVKLEMKPWFTTILHLDTLKIFKVNVEHWCAEL